jgi:hypothetical protein
MFPVGEVRPATRDSPPESPRAGSCSRCGTSTDGRRGAPGARSARAASPAAAGSEKLALARVERGREAWDRLARERRDDPVVTGAAERAGRRARLARGRAEERAAEERRLAAVVGRSDGGEEDRAEQSDKSRRASSRWYSPPRSRSAGDGTARRPGRGLRLDGHLAKSGQPAGFSSSFELVHLPVTHRGHEPP